MNCLVRLSPVEAFYKLFEDTKKNQEFRQSAYEAYSAVYGIGDRNWSAILPELNELCGTKFDAKQWSGHLSNLKRRNSKRSEKAGHDVYGYPSADRHYILLTFYLASKRSDPEIGWECTRQTDKIFDSAWGCSLENQCERKGVDPSELFPVSKPQIPETDPNLKPLEIVEPDAGNWLSPFNLTSITLKRRDAELERLRAFADSPAPYALWALIAPSGAGKTRLAAEWMLECREERGWHVGFLDNLEPDPWSDWRPTANTLIVVDYIHNYGKAIKAILDRCKTLGNENALASTTVRILAIDHVFPGRFADILHYAHWGEVFENKITLDARKDVFFAETPLRLSDSEDRDSVLREIIAEVGGELAEDDERVVEAMDALKKMEDAAQHPLFAALMGDAIYRNVPEYKSWNRIQLIEYYLDTKNRLPWLWDDNPVGFWVGCVVATATIRDGADKAALFDLMPDTETVGGKEIEVSSARPVIEAQYTHITSSPVLWGRLEAFKPDILGEFFTLLFLGEILSSKYKRRKIFIRMISASDANGDFLRHLMAWGEFFLRLTRNLCNYDQSARRIETFWNDLDAFLNPEYFPVGTDARYAISIIRGEIAGELDRRGFCSRRKQFLRGIQAEDLAAAAYRWKSRDGLLMLFQLYERSEQSEECEATFCDLAIKTALKFENQSSTPFDSRFEGSFVPLLFEHGCQRILEALLIREVLPKQNYSFRNLCTNSVVSNNPLSLNLLIDYGADILEEDYLARHVPLEALQHGSFSIISMLVDKGFDPDTPCSDGFNCLMAAADRGDLSPDWSVI